jgi:class 3 adenylate cyclase
MDIHDLPGVTAEAVAEAHYADVRVQERHGVSYHKYWINQQKGKIYCLCEAPSAEAADAVHREAHGLPAARIMEVTPDLADAFMGMSEVNGAGAVVLPDKSGHDPGTRTILFTDIVGSTGMTQRLGDEAALDVLAAHDRIVRDALAANNGAEIKHTGDGIMAVFVSAACGARCAISIMRDLAAYCASNPGSPLEVRVGLAAGEPIERAHDLFGTTVQLAARLCAYAEPRQILASNVVAELCLGKMLAFRDVGHLSLKGFEQPVHAHAIELA